MCGGRLIGVVVVVVAGGEGVREQEFGQFALAKWDE